MSEESLYLHYAKLDMGKLADLSRYFGEEDYWRLFCRVARRLGLRRRPLGGEREVLRHGL